MSFIPPLSNAAINLASLRDAARKELITMLSSAKTKKALVLDKDLSGPLGLLAEVDLLKKHGVEKMFHLLPSELHTECPNIIYLVRPQMHLMTLIADQIKQMMASGVGQTKKYRIYFVPRRTMLCEKILNDAGVLGDVEIGECPLELFPLDDDLLSLELPLAFKECVLDGDPTSLYYVAKSIHKLQSITGTIPNIKGKGDDAERVFQLLQRMKRETAAKGPVSASLPEIDTLIIIDRNVDMITPLLTQMTYEGLLDEMFGIQNGYIDVATELLGGSLKKQAPSEGPGPMTKKLPLNSSDDLFREIRDMNFGVLGPVLHKKAELIKDTYAKRHDAQSVSEMHNFMTEFKTAHHEHAFLQTHINLAGQIGKTYKSMKFKRKIEMENHLLSGEEGRAVEEYIDECISKQEPLLVVLRLVCLMSQTMGIRAKKFDTLKRDLIQTYGLEVMFTLTNLETVGLFCKAKRNTWPQIKKSLRLLSDPSKMNREAPEDISFSYGGYAPLLVRLVELACRPGWKRMEDVLAQLPGKFFEHTEDPSFDGHEHAPQAQRKKPLVLVYFLGGATFAEVSALRHLSERENHGYDYLVAATKLCTGATLLDSIVEKVQNNLDLRTL